MDAVEEVKARLSIEDVVSPYVDLKRSGTGLKGLCPFHSEKTPSFTVSPSRGTFHCFGCGQGGDIFTFVQNHDKVEFGDALRLLAARAGVELPDERVRQQRADANSRLFQANDAAVEFFRDQLATVAGKRAVAYLDSRKIDAQSRQVFGLGYAPDTRTAMKDALGKRGFSDEELIASGLIYPPQEGSPSRDRFYNRLMFPIRDAKGRVTGFGGRILGDGEPKYLNSPQTELFDKSHSLFAIELAQEPIRQSKRAVVVEGYFDAIRPHAAGFTNVVASLGTAITPAQLQLCARMAETVVLALDPDAAGQAAAARTAMGALAALPRRRQQLSDSLNRRMVDVGLAVDLRIARIPPGAGDPDELILRDPKAWEQVIGEAVPAFEFYFDTVVTSVDRSSDAWRQEVIDRIIPVIQEFPFAVGVQAAWIERLSSVTGVQPRLLQNRLPAAPAPGDAARQRQPTRRGSPRIAQTPPALKQTDPLHDAEEFLLRILLERPCPAEVGPALSEIRPDRQEASDLLHRCAERAGIGRRPTLEGLSEAAHELARRIENRPLDNMSDARVLSNIQLHIATIRLTLVKRKIDSLQSAIQELNPEDRDMANRSLDQYFDERSELEKQIGDLQVATISGV